MTTKSKPFAKAWPHAEAIQLQQTAEQLFHCDVHEQHGEYREHWRLRMDQKPEDGPNYADWARCYVEAQRPIPVIWLDAFYSDQLHSTNTLYADALRRDIATFGVRFTT